VQQVIIGCNQIKTHTNQRVARPKKEEQKGQKEEKEKL
jgi:hypothetical protein